jgi:hypothetical protein
MFSYKSSIEYGGEPPADGDPELVYLNLDIINNNTLDATSQSIQDPLIRFIETRDAPIIKNASKYQFSITRFVMNGANKDLPLFIPVIKTTASTIPAPVVAGLTGGVSAIPQNITEYESAISYSQEWILSTGPTTFTITPDVLPLIYSSQTQNPVLAPIPRDPTIAGMDIATRYYWVYEYQSWVDLTNTALQNNYVALLYAFQQAWIASGTPDAFPFTIDAAGVAAFQAITGPAPQMIYNADSGLFTLQMCEKSFGERITPLPGVAQGGNVASVATTNPASRPVCRLFFDSNMFGLYSNFDNIYYGGPTSGALGPFPLTPVGYTNEIQASNKNYTNILDLRPTPVGPSLLPIPALDAQIYWLVEQDYESTSSLWSPISSVVFTTTLLPVRNEYTGAPIILGTSNVGTSNAASIQNAFQPIITDIAADLANDGADAYRKMLYYSPVAEYRMASLTPSKQPINSIDIQVFWRNRLDGNLYPITMFNLSSVSVKCMFRRIRQ